MISREYKRKNMILIIEDSLTSLMILEKICENINLKYKSTSSSLESLKLFNDFSFNMCLIDIQLPVINGIELNDRFKMINPNIYTIAITAGDLRILNLSRFNYVLQKPFLMKDLEDLLCKLI